MQTCLLLGASPINPIHGAISVMGFCGIWIHSVSVIGRDSHGCPSLLLIRVQVPFDRQSNHPLVN